MAVVSGSSSASISLNSGSLGSSAIFHVNRGGYGNKP